MTRAKNDHLQSNLARIIEAMKRAGYASASVTYDGGGDNGQFYEPVYTKADGTTVGDPHKGHYVSPEEQNKKMKERGAITVVQTAVHYVWIPGEGENPGTHRYKAVGERTELLSDALIDFAGVFVDGKHGGWENNDGGQGDLIVDVKTRTATLDHTTFYMESRTDTASLKAPARAPAKLVQKPDDNKVEVK
jgi:hypothetical protein